MLHTHKNIHDSLLSIIVWLYVQHWGSPAAFCFCQTKDFSPPTLAVHCGRGSEKVREDCKSSGLVTRSIGKGQAWKRLALQLADAAREPLERPLTLLPPLEGGDHQLPSQPLSHHQVGCINIIHLIAGTLQATFEPQHCLLQIPFSHPIQLVDGFALCFRGDLGVPIDVGDLLHFYLQG